MAAARLFRISQPLRPMRDESVTGHSHARVALPRLVRRMVATPIRDGTRLRPGSFRTCLVLERRAAGRYAKAEIPAQVKARTACKLGRFESTLAASLRTTPNHQQWRCQRPKGQVVSLRPRSRDRKSLPRMQCSLPGESARPRGAAQSMHPIGHLSSKEILHDDSFLQS